MADDGNQQRKPGLNLRSPAVLAAIGVVATLVLALVVVMALLRTGDTNAVSDNAALIGALVALGGVFTAQIVSISLEDQRTQESREIEDRRTQVSRNLEAQRANEAALQNYFENVGKLLIEKPLHRASPGDRLSTVVRAHTLGVLQGLDPNRKRFLLQFLFESGLINREKRVVSLAFADLTGADLHRAFLYGSTLYLTDMDEADLSGAFLNDADLRGALLRRANLGNAYLQGAKLIEAKLDEADLSGASLDEADLSEATGISNEKLEQQAASLEGATMPNGQKYEEWLKSESRREDGESSSS